ncbi:MAG: hypothetical protein HC820_06830 [Hydrococcus sp. RM1_1_31]|nr:hypothetical protein [Hydrococcus sp. RM1_1_31]
MIAIENIYAKMSCSQSRTTQIKGIKLNKMSTDLSNNDRKSSTASIVEALENLSQPANRMILMGSPEWVRGIIHKLHCLGVAEVGSWSKLIPIRSSGEVISILKRSRGQELEPPNN